MNDTKLADICICEFFQSPVFFVQDLEIRTTAAESRGHHTLC